MVDISWRSLSKVGGAAALLVVPVALLDIVMMVPGGVAGPETLNVSDWFTLLREHWFVGLHHLGLPTVVNTALTVPVLLALYAANRQANQAVAALAAILGIMGATMYIANNAALPMLALSGQYAAATAESQKSLLIAAGQAVLAKGLDTSAGAFMGFFFSEAANIIMAWVMVRSGVFRRITALTGMLAFGLLLIFNVVAAFVSASSAVAMLCATVGGLLAMAWNVSVGLRLLRT